MEQNKKLEALESMSFEELSNIDWDRVEVTNIIEAAIWNITTIKRVYFFQTAEAMKSFAKFWSCEYNERELLCYITR